jgi:dihydroxyacetone kinase-like predicted kinase
VVVPSETIPQGISALLAFNYQSDLEKNAEAMTKAIHSVQTAEITRAIRSVKYNGLEVEEGEVIGLLNGELTASGSSIGGVILELLEQMKAEEHEIITAYYGEDIEEAQAAELVKELSERYPQQDWELVDGGQPHYYYILSAE